VTWEIEPAGDVVKLTLLQSHDRPDQRRHFVGRPRRLAGDPLQSQEHAGDGQRDGDPDAAAGADAGCVEGVGIGTPYY